MLFVSYYLGGEVTGQGNMWYYNASNGRKYRIPDDVRDIYFLNEVWIPTVYLDYISKSGIAHHFLKHGFYQTTYIPSTNHSNWFIYHAQLKAYKDARKRLLLAKTFVRTEITLAGIFGSVDVSDLLGRLKDVNGISRLRQIEGEAMKRYYQAKKEEYPEFHGRMYNPSPDRYNALISMAYAYLYGTAFSAIKMAGLDPRIGFLHENRFRTYSLHLDVADMYKPIVADFALRLTSRFSRRCFYRIGRGVYLKDRCFRKFATYWDEMIRDRTKPWCGNLSFIMMMTRDVRNLRGYLVKGEKEFIPCLLERGRD